MTQTTSAVKKDAASPGMKQTERARAEVGQRSTRARASVRFRVRRLRFEVRLIVLLALLALPALAAAIAALWAWHASAETKAIAIAVLAGVLVALGRAVFWHIVRPLQTLSNIVSALRENEYSFRAREVGRGDALGDLAAQINELAGDLRMHRNRELETFALLERVVETMDLPVFAFDAASCLQLTNPAAAKMLDRPEKSMLRQPAESLGLTEALECRDNGVVVLSSHGHEGRWMVRRSRFYQNGVPHMLLLLSDVSGVLREQERKVWQRLIRVLAHEVNNSLTPIKSIAGSLRSGVERDNRNMNPVDMEHGLAIIEERADSLNHFLLAYTQLAKLPPPVMGDIAVAPLLERVCHLETRLAVTLEAGCAKVHLPADLAQMEQALINLVRNAVDAALQEHGGDGMAQVTVRCGATRGGVSVAIEDNGPGLANPGNLFIPFYTTKPGGSGIGLVLALQIIEAHGGTLTLSNRKDAQGCLAEIRFATV